MAKVTVPAQAQNEQKSEMLVVGGEILIPQTDDVNGQPDGNQPPAPPAEAVIPDWMKVIIAARLTEDEANVKTLATLNDALRNANIAYVAAMQAANFDHMSEAVIAARLEVKAKDDAIIDFTKANDLLKLEREAADQTNVAKYDLAERLGLTPARIEELMAMAQDAKDKLKASFQVVFGKPVFYAKPGQTGKDVTKSQAASGDKKTDVVTQSVNVAGGNPEKAGSKRHEIWNDLASGMTKEQLLAKYPTDGNAGKLNGTCRTVISDGGWKLTEAGHYQIG